MNFNFLNFCTKYKCEGDMQVKLDRYACFSNIFRGDAPNKLIHNKYTIYIYDDLTCDNFNNCCLLNKQQIIEFIEEGKKFHKFDYTLTRVGDHYTLKVDLLAIKSYHKFLLTWFRYLYEFPYNVCLYDTFKARNFYGFKRLSLINTFNVLSASLQYEVLGTDIHCIGVFKTIKELKNNKSISKTLKEVDWLNDIFKSSFDYNKYEIKRVPRIIETKEKNLTYKSGEYWLNEEAFNKRLKIYRHNIKQIRKIEL